jgi:hypothetical protein
MRPLGRPRRRWENNDKNDIKAMKWENVGLVSLIQDRKRREDFLNMIMKFEFQKIGNF